jgi:hypothetical protein
MKINFFLHVSLLTLFVLAGGFNGEIIKNSEKQVENKQPGSLIYFIDTIINDPEFVSLDTLQQLHVLFAMHDYLVSVLKGKKVIDESSLEDESSLMAQHQIHANRRK